MPIQQARLRWGFPTGISFSRFLALVPESVEMAACHAANYRYYGDWQELEPEQRYKLIAHYQLERMITNHTEDAAVQHIKHEQRRKGNKGGA